MKWRWGASSLVLALLLATLLATAFSAQTMRAQTGRLERATPRTIQEPALYWERHGFVAMVAPVRPPTTPDGRARIFVYLKLPLGGRLRVLIDEKGEAQLSYPVGTVAVRVEYVTDSPSDAVPDATWRVADVRGTELSDGGELFHVYRPTTLEADATLLGVTWNGLDRNAQEEATEYVGALLEQRRVFAAANAAVREKSARKLKQMNDCSGCHLKNRPPRRAASDPGVVNRGTDAAGFFHVPSVLADAALLETYRPANANLSDPFMRFACGSDARPARVEPGKATRVSCDDGSLPFGIKDMKSALRAGDIHATAVCASRRFLYEHLDEVGRATFAPAMQSCAER